MSFDSIDDAYKQITGFPSANPMQRHVWEHIEVNEQFGIGLLLKSMTGSGKTESFAIPALVRGRRLIMVYPTRSLVDDQIGRFKEYLQKLSAAKPNKTFTLTVDTGTQSIRTCWKKGKEEKPTGGRGTRHLYFGDVIITTLDKFLYRFFGFGEPKKSYIYPLRIRYMNPIICFDEAHSYDKVAFTNFERLVRTLYEKGKDVALMTATMPAELAACFDYLDTADFVTGPDAQQLQTWERQKRDTAFYPNKKLTYYPESIKKEDDEPYSPAVGRIITEAQQQASLEKRLIVTVESVKDAAQVFLTLRETIQDVPLFFYHGRLTDEQRRSVYKDLKELDGNDASYVLVSTSAIEVGCDLNAHTLITQLCDPDKLIQRAGRCNRKQAIPDAQLIIVGDDIPEWTTAYTDSDRKQTYITAVQTQNGRSFQPNDLLPLGQKQLANDPRVEIMFDMLYEYVYEAKLENRNLHRNGLVITRSWEPSITLCQGEGKNGLIHRVTVPISYCRVPKDAVPLQFLSGDGLSKWVYDNTTQQRTLKSLGKWENGYSNDIILQVANYIYTDGSLFNVELGYIDLPPVFHGPFPRGGKRILEHGVDNDKVTIWYIDPDGITARPLDFLAAIAENKDPEAEDSDEGENDE